MGIGMGVAAVFVACGGNSSGPTHVEISGRTPTEAATIAAQTVCTRDARCGHVTISCSGGGAAGGSGSDAGAPTFSCVATIEPIAYADCYEDANGDIAHLLTCAAPTPDQTDMLEQCFDALAARPCVTQSEADALARASETGTSPPPEDLPAACALLANPPPGC
jgi:hypothetical protein